MPFLGGLAQLARALALHARGHRFDSDILHCYPYHIGDYKDKKFIDILELIEVVKNKSIK